MPLIETQRGDSPVVLGLPHTGTFVPPEVAKDLNETGQNLADTDWDIDQLYTGLLAGVTSVRTTVHRYVIDVNRGPEGHSLYPGQNTTGLCPLTDFDGNPIYKAGKDPAPDEIQRRLETYHCPYHTALQAELDRVRDLHGFVILYDCHSIRSHIPFLFDGVLPDFNIGTDSGRSCGGEIARLTEEVCRTAEGYSTILNGRFKGGWTTRHYGDPSRGVHAIQMELAQSTYMLERPPWSWEQAKADAIRAPLRSILEHLSVWRPK